MKHIKKILALTLSIFAPAIARAESWTPLITSSSFDGIKADMITMVGGIVTLFFIVLGLAMLMRAGGR